MPQKLGWLVMGLLFAAGCASKGEVEKASPAVAVAALRSADQVAITPVEHARRMATAEELKQIQDLLADANLEPAGDLQNSSVVVDLTFTKNGEFVGEAMVYDSGAFRLDTGKAYRLKSGNLTSFVTER